MQVPVSGNPFRGFASSARESGNFGRFLPGSLIVYFSTGFYFSAGPSGVLPVAKEKRKFWNSSTENRVKNGLYLTFSQKFRFLAAFRIILWFSIMTSIFLSLDNNLFFNFIEYRVKKGLKNENIFWRFWFWLQKRLKKDENRADPREIFCDFGLALGINLKNRKRTADFSVDLFLQK